MVVAWLIMTCSEPTKIKAARLEESSVDCVDIGDTLVLCNKTLAKRRHVYLWRRSYLYFGKQSLVSLFILTCRDIILNFCRIYLRG